MMRIKESCRLRFAPVIEAVQKLTVLTKESAKAGAEASEIREKPILIGIDGMCATGKTTLGYYLKELFDCNLFHMDDFFLSPQQRTPERMAEVGGNVDYERFREEVLWPVCRKEAVLYRPYCCKTGELEQGVRIPYRRLNIIEGSYSLHPFFGDLYDLRIFTESAPDRQLQNIRARNGEAMVPRFVTEWIPKENAYFEKFEIREGCIIVPWTEASAESPCFSS